MWTRATTALQVLLILGGIHDALCLPATTQQQPMQLEPIVPNGQDTRPRKLHGRFLHLTDMHPDPFYRAGTSEKSACHRKKPKKARPRASEFGFLYGECDSPLLLTNYTLDYLEKNWADDVDFVIWTGDSARHDNDRKLPRTLKEIYQLNRQMVSRMEEIFTARGIPVIPSIGNNDVWPHNIMLPGPNDVTFEFSSIWKSFVPFHSYQVFQRGAYYSVEVIPNQLAVVSLNTMYWFDSNKAVAGCDPKDREDPGNLQFDWLEVQLSQFRRRGMQVWLSGHVPPSARNYHTECHIRYVELSLRYQDTILGHLYGHMNADHFFVLDATNLHPDTNAKTRVTEPARIFADNDVDVGGIDSEDDTVSVSGKHRELYKSLLKDFNHISKKSSKKLDYDALTVVNVGPSVVPNPYLPSFRIYAYNLSGEGYAPSSVGIEGGDAGYSINDEDDDDENLEDLELDSDEDEEEADWIRDGFTSYDEGENGLVEEEATQVHGGQEVEVGHHLGDYVNRESWCPTGKQQSWACLLTERWHSSPRSPSRTNRLFTPLGYAQYYLPDMNGTAKKPPKWKLEYLTFAPSKLHPPKTTGETTAQQWENTTVVEGAEIAQGKGKEKFLYPVPLKRLPKKLRQPDVKKSKYAPYKMADLTIPSWLRLVKRLGKKKNEKLRQRFRRYMYMGANAEL
ncbi:Metallo-dependent phosphatase-like protein [Irpex lacteus]|nr:Metallo-dependent phosphatase-like protein [Irpex lacteus]